jgi:hypothetical protein
MDPSFVLVDDPAVASFSVFDKTSRNHHYIEASLWSPERQEVAEPTEIGRVLQKSWKKNETASTTEKMPPIRIR